MMLPKPKKQKVWTTSTWTYTNPWPSRFVAGKKLINSSQTLDHIFCFVHLLFRRTRSARRVLCQSWSPGEGWLCHSQTEPPILQNLQRILSSQVRDKHKGQRATFFRLLVRDPRFQARVKIRIFQVIFFALKIKSTGNYFSNSFV